MSEAESFATAMPGDDFVYLAAFQQLVLERTHDLITVLEPSGTVVYASPSWRTLAGWDPNALVGTSFLELTDPDDPELAAAIVQVLSGATIQAVSGRLRTHDGKWIAIESTGTPIYDRDGRVAYVLGTARDVSEREALRERVSEVDAMYRVADAIARATTLEELLDEAVDTLLEATGADRAAVLLRDDAGVMRFRASRGLSDEYCAQTEGHSPWAEDETDALPMLVADIAAADFDAELERSVRSEGIAALAFIPLVHGDRLLGKFMLYHDEPHEWGAREVRLCGTIANHLASATVRTRARTALRESREQLETIMRTVHEGIIVQPSDGRLAYANDAAARTIGFESTAELLASDRTETLARFEMLDELGNPLLADDLPGRRALRGESSEQVVRYRIRDTGTEHWSIVRANPVRSADGTVALAVSVIHDVTDSRAAEERLRFLGRGSEMLNETLAVERTLAALADLAVPTFAGHVTVDLYADGA